MKNETIRDSCTGRKVIKKKFHDMQLDLFNMENFMSIPSPKPIPCCVTPNVASVGSTPPKVETKNYNWVAPSWLVN